MQASFLTLFIGVEIVKFISCQTRPTGLKLLNFHKNPKRSQPMRVELLAKAASGLSEFYYYWTITSSSDTSKILQSSRTSSINIDGYNFPVDLVYGSTFILTAMVSHYSDYSNSEAIDRTFKFLPDDLILNLKGGPVRTHIFSKDLVVDATESRDPSYRANENPFKGNSIWWSVTPYVHQNISKNSLVLKIPKSELKRNQVLTVNFTMERFKVNRQKKEMIQVITIVGEDIPEIYLRCVRNCLFPNPGGLTYLVLDCHENCGKDFNDTVWILDPPPPPTMIDFGTGYNKIMIKEETFDPSTTLNVKVDFRGAVATYKMTFVGRFQVGVCKMVPSSGISGITLFKVICTGFESRYGFLLYMIFQRYREGEDGVLLSASTTPDENDVYLAAGSPAVVSIRVLDNVYMKEDIQIKLEVEPYPRRTLIDIRRLMLVENQESVYTFAKAQDRNRVVQIVSFLIETIAGNKGIEGATLEDLHKHLAWNVFNVKPNSFYSGIQTLSIVNKLLDFKIPTDTYTSRILARCIKEAAVALYFAMSYDQLLSTPKAYIKIFAEDFMNISAKILKKNEAVESFLSTPTPVQIHDYDSYDDMDASKLKVRSNLRELTENIILSVDVVSRTFMHDFIVNQKELLFSKPNMAFKVGRLSLPLGNNSKFTLQSFTMSSIFVTKNLDEELRRENDYIDYFLMAFVENPFWWHRNASKLNSNVLFFSVFKGCKNISSYGTSLSSEVDYSPFDYFETCDEIKKTKGFLYVSVRTPVTPTGLLKGTISQDNFGNTAAHRFKLETGNQLVLVFKKVTHDYQVTSSICYCTEADFKEGIRIKAEPNHIFKTLIVTGKSPSNFVYVCIKNLEPQKELTYMANFSAFSCVSWDSLNGMWVSTGCELVFALLNNDSTVVCKCNHFSFFTAHSYIPQNQLNLNMKIDFTIHMVQNSIMLVFVSFLWILWISLFIWAWQQDKKFQKLNVVHKLDDTVPGDTYGYLMVVFTGIYIDARTSADVAFQLIGDKSKSRIHLIRCSGARLLQRDAQDWFLVFTPEELGNIRVLRLWHNCKGRNPHWYCERVLVQSLKTGTQFCFIVEKWFSLIWGDGKVYHKIIVEKEIGLRSPKALLSAKLRNDLKNQHLWMSIFARDPQSNFTSKERVSAAVSILFLSLLVNCMIYGIPLREPQDSIDPQPSFFITYKQIFVLVEALVITLPLSLVIILIFKNSEPYGEKRVKKRSKKKVKKSVEIEDLTE